MEASGTVLRCNRFFGCTAFTSFRFIEMKRSGFGNSVEEVYSIRREKVKM